MVHGEQNGYQRRDMDHLEDPAVGARRQGEPVLCIEEGENGWVVMLLGVVCSDGTTEFEAYVRVSRAEIAVLNQE